MVDPPYGGEFLKSVLGVIIPQRLGSANIVWTQGLTVEVYG
jgi:hypothetical protein